MKNIIATVFFNDFGEYDFSDRTVIAARVPFHFVVYNSD